MKENKKEPPGHSATISKFPCPLCGENLFNVIFSAPDFDTGEKYFSIVECNSCNLVKTEPVLTDDKLSKYYDIEYFGSGMAKFSGFTEMLTRFFSHQRARSILSHMNRDPLLHMNSSPKILDIGCGRGNLLHALKRMGCLCHGIERTEFPMNTPPHDIHIHKEKLENICCAEGCFDAAVIWHVLEHMENPLQALQETTRILRPGGLLAIAVPNFGSFQARLFRENWFHLDLPRHRHHFTSDILVRFLEKNRFSIVSKHTFSLEQNPFGFIQSFFNKIADFAKPNHFYSLLRKKKGPLPALGLLLWTAFAIFILPFALVEYLLSGIQGKGATLIIYAKKC